MKQIDKIMEEKTNDIDLEDGEIESDSEEDKKSEKDKANENLSNETKLTPLSVTTCGGGDGSNKSSSTTNKLSQKQGKNSFEDDWADNVENAIAMALKKDGIDVPKNSTTTSGGCDSENKSNKSNKKYQIDTDDRHKKKRKKKEADNDKRKKRLKLDHDTDKTQSDEIIDEYEMMCIRGGSPPPINVFKPTAQSLPLSASLSSRDHRSNDRNNDEGHNQSAPGTSCGADYDSGESYSSYDSYDSGDYRRLTYEERRQRRRNRNDRRRGSNAKSGKLLEKRRSGRGDHHDSDNDSRMFESRILRKMELCKFYLMDCCAKRDKCLYMHSDFPCKYYYLGLKCINWDNCKFSHGKPLTDTLTNVLLKHLETAPKEILGDFPRISRDRAVNMINATHTKLMYQYNMLNPDQQQQQQQQINSDVLQANIQRLITNKNKMTNDLLTTNDVKIPSLLDIETTKPLLSSPLSRKDETSEKFEGVKKSEKPRKSRWCDNTSTVTTTTTTITTTAITTRTPPTTTLKVPHSQPKLSGTVGLTVSPTSGSTASTNYLSLRNLTGVITQNQIDSLAAMGIETLDQVKYLTFMQLTELGLSINQLSEIQLNAINIEKLGLSSSGSGVITTGVGSMAKTSNQSMSVTAIAGTSTVTTTAATQYNTSTITNNSAALPAANINESSNDMDMRCLPIKSQNDNLRCPQDIDMRFLTPALTTPQSDQLLTTINIPTALNDISIKEIASPDAACDRLSSDYNIEKILKSDNDGPPGVMDFDSYLNKNQVSVVDYSQYLKDSNLKPDTIDVVKNNDEITGGGTEDEPKLLIDESWCPSDEDSLKVSQDIFNGNNTEETSDIDLTQKLSENVDNTYYWPLTPAVLESTSMTKLGNLSKVDLSSSVSQILQSESTSQQSSQMTNDSNYYSSDMLSQKSSIDKVPDSLGSSLLPTSVTISSIAGIKENIEQSLSDTNTEQQSHLNPHSVQRDPRQRNRVYDDYSSSPSSMSPGRKSITQPDQLDGDGNLINKTLPSINNQSIGKEESSPTPSATDQDMRLVTGYFFESDFKNRDVDLRLPFKPMMKNYVPATEINASVTSHPQIPWKLIEYDISPPDYSEIRRSLPLSEISPDPRLGRILRQKNNDIETGPPSSVMGTTPDNTVVTPTSSSDPILNKYSSDRQLVKSTIRQDPRRKNLNESKLKATATISTSVSQQQGIDIQVLLQKSPWYKELGSKNKIIVNQQLAIMSTELKKFNQDQSPNKTFDLNFLQQNRMLQQILTNLGIYLNENGQFLSQAGNVGGACGLGNNMSSGLLPGAEGLLINDPIIANLTVAAVTGPGTCPMGLDLLQQQRNNYMQSFSGPSSLNQQQQPQQGRFLDNIRPGLLGMAPNLPYQSYDTNDLGNFINYNDDPIQSGYQLDYEDSINFSGPGGGYYGGGNRNKDVPRGRNYRGGGGNNGGRNNNGNDRWSGAGSNNNSRSSRGSHRRHPYDSRDRNSRRDKSKN